MITEEVIAAAKKLWDYHHMHQPLRKADAIFVLGSHDTRVAERAAELYFEGWAPMIIFSGGLGNFTKDMWTEAEADKFAAIAIEIGVPAEKILKENKSSNTGENILFTQKLLEEKGLDIHSFIVVQKPNMERRSYATFKRHWPEKELTVTSPQIPFEEYPTDEITLERVINIMVGDLQRIRIYPGKGFQIYQEIPADVWDAYEKLIAAGFTSHLIS